MRCPITSTLERLRGDAPAALSQGFRPLFFAGALYAGAAVLLWLLMFRGSIDLPTAFAPRDWHVHEMLFGFVPAIMGGFLLTAIPNWTGRLPIRGLPLLGLVAAWMAGRIAVAVSGEIGWLPAALVDSVFLLALVAAAAREIAAGKNWRNLPIVFMAAAFASANAAFHIEGHFGGVADVSIRAALSMIVLLIALIGGRIVPSFTANHLTRQRSQSRAAPFGAFDKAVLAASAAALAAWTALAEEEIVAIALIAAGLLQAVRLARWAGHRTWRETLLFVLHVAYAFVPLGFVLVGFAALGWMPASAGTHAWAVGAIGMMTLAVMSRASLGHTGRALTASPATQLIYGAVLAAAVARVAATIEPSWSEILIAAASFLWAFAFLGFGAVYGPILWRPRKSKPAS